MGYEISRDEVVAAALSLQGAKFRHQGRDAATGVDCVGLLVVIGKLINYPEIIDAEAYRRTPSAQVIRETLAKNCDEISVSEVRRGDFYLMRTGGRKPRHAAIRISDEIDVEKGIEPKLIHAYGNGQTGKVIIEPVRVWKDDFVCGFRLRGLQN